MILLFSEPLGVSRTDTNIYSQMRGSKFTAFGYSFLLWRILTSVKAVKRL